MELSANKINELYRFTERKLVEHYDVQAELVDHLANDIESIITENPKIDFKEAKLIAYRKFGVFGFSDIAEQKTNQLRKKYMKIIFRDLTEWFKLPKIISTLCLTFLVYLLLHQYNILNLFYTIQLSILLFIVFKTFVNVKKLRIRKKNHQKIWLLEQLIFTNAAFVYFSGLGNLIFFISRFIESHITKNSNNWLPIFVSIILTIEFLLVYISFYVIPKKSEALLKENYPEYTAL